MSLLLVDVAIVGGGFLLGRWIVRSVRARRAAAAGASDAVREKDAAAPKERAVPPRDPLAGFECKLGDVLVRVAERDEAWLAGALVFEEERPAAVLFIAPEAGGDRGLFMRPAPASGVTWLAPLAKGELALTPDPPHTLEHEGVRFVRVRRLPVKVTRLGSGAPSVGAQAIVAEYTGAAADRILVVAGAEQTLAWKGVALGEGEYDVLPGDKSTLA